MDRCTRSVPAALPAVFVVAGTLTRREAAGDIVLCYIINVPADAEEHLDPVLPEEVDGPRAHSAGDDQVDLVLREEDREPPRFVAGVLEVVPPVDDRTLDIKDRIPFAVPEVPGHLVSVLCYCNSHRDTCSSRSRAGKTARKHTTHKRELS